MPAIETLYKVLELVKETGDRCILVLENREPIVVMNVESYRTLLASAAKRQELSRLSEQELLDHINAQIAEWKEGRKREREEYDLAQFRVEAPRSKEESTPPRGVTPSSEKHADAAMVQNLPVVEKPDEDTYHLEPL